MANNQWNDQVGNMQLRHGNKRADGRMVDIPNYNMQNDASHSNTKNFIAGAIKHPGAETAAAKRAGVSTHAYMEEHKHDSGTAGKRARLGLTLSKLAKK